MHNLHLAVVYGDNPKEACDDVESNISDFGNENNWRTICGCVSEDDEVYIQDEGCFPPDKETNTIKKLNTLASKWADANGTGQGYADGAPELLKKHQEGVKLKGGDWWKIEQYAKHMSQALLSPKRFNVLKHEYMEYEYDCNGVTQFDDYKPEGYKQYVVFIDIHS